MNSLEKLLLEARAIPLSEASEYFLELREFPKTAAKETPTDDELKETGRQRGVTSTAAEHERDKSRRGERTGKAIGAIGGLAAGGALGRSLVGGPMGALGGAALGGLAGRSLGGELGTEVDIARSAPAASPVDAVLKTAAARMAAWVKSAADEPALAQGGPEAQMTSPTDKPELMPANYLQAEAMGQEAQNSNEADYFKSKARDAEQAVQQAQDQALQMSAGTEQLQAEADSTAQRIQASLQEAMKARDEALQQTEIAANLRMAMQKQRQMMMEVASQDPAADAAGALGGSLGGALPPAPPAEPPMEGQAMAPEGGAPGAGKAPDQKTAPGASPPAGAKDMNAPAGGPPGPPTSTAHPAGGVPPMGEKTSSVKTAFYGALGGAALGAAVGAGSVAVDRGKNVGEMQERLSELQRTTDGSYAQAAASARLQKQIVDTQMAQQFPTQVAARRAAGTALNFGLRGAGIEGSIRRLGRA